MSKEETQFKPGKSGNPNGRPKKPEVEGLRNAIQEVENQAGRKPLLVHFVEQAYEDKGVLIALAKKLLPDMKSADINITSKTFTDIVRDIINARNSRKSDATS